MNIKNILPILSLLVFQTILANTLQSVDDYTREGTKNLKLVLPPKNLGEVKSFSMTPDGRYVLSTAESGTCLWDMKLGKLLRVIEDYAIFSAISDNGKWGLLCSQYVVKYYNLMTGEMLGGGPENNRITSIAISPDGKTGAVGMSDVGVHIINLLNGKVTKIIDGYSGSVLGLTFIKNGTVLASASDFGEIKLIDAETWKVLDEIKIDGIIKQISFDQNGKFSLYNEGTNEIIYYDLVQNKPLNLKEVKESFWQMPLTVSGDGNYGMTGADDGCIELWDLKNMINLSTFCGHVGKTTALKISPDGKYALSGGEDGFIKIWDLTLKKELKTLNKNSNKVLDFSGTPDNRYLAYGVDSTIRIWDMQRGKILQDLYIQNAIPNFNNEEMLTGFMGLKISSGLMISPDGKYVAASGLENTYIWEVESGKIIKTIHGISPFSITPDFKYGIFMDVDKRINYYDLQSNKLLLKFDSLAQYLNTVQISLDGKFALCPSAENSLIWLDLRTGKQIKKLYGKNPYVIMSLSISPDNKKALVSRRGGVIEIWDLVLGKIIFQVDQLQKSDDSVLNNINIAEDFKQMSMGVGATATCVSVTPDFRYMLAGDNMGVIYLYDIHDDLKLLSMIPDDAGKVNSVSLAQNGQLAYVSYYNNTVKIWDLKKKEVLVTIIPFKTDDYVLMTPEGYYSSTKSGISQLGYADGQNYYGFEQFDLKYNRPDIVLRKMGVNDTNLIASLNHAYLKRLNKLGVSENNLNDDVHVPDIQLLNKTEIPLSVPDETLSLNIQVTDSKYMLDRIHVWINGVPVYGLKGYSIRQLNTHQYKAVFPIGLSAGDNKIEISCLNEVGAESFKEMIYTNCQKNMTSSKIWYIGIGVSRYKDSTMNLTYAEKDIKDLCKTFSESRNISSEEVDVSIKNMMKAGIIAPQSVSLINQKNNPSVEVITLLNEQVTKENILALKQKLMKTNIEDKVIISASGHGLLSNNLDFYFATYDMDFNQPEKRGLLYDDLENLLDSIPARKKLLMIDACHSGEVDKDEMEIDNTLLAQNNVVEKRGSQSVVNKNGIGLNNSFELMRELFADVSKGTGAIVISAAGGKEYALESKQWNNGVFTYCVRKALEENAADKNGDKEISMSELKEYVSREVETLTQGKQKPTSRKENLEFDWKVK